MSNWSNFGRGLAIGFGLAAEAVAETNRQEGARRERRNRLHREMGYLDADERREVSVEEIICGRGARRRRMGPRPLRPLRPLRPIGGDAAAMDVDDFDVEMIEYLCDVLDRMGIHATINRHRDSLVIRFDYRDTDLVYRAWERTVDAFY